MTGLSSFLARLEAASGPDQRLDRELWEVVVGECTHRRTHFIMLENDERQLECTDCGADTYGSDKWSGLTRSLDAALALCERVLPGWEVLLSNEGAVPSDWVASIGPRGTFTSYEAVTPAPARSLCIAIVKALIAQKDKQDE